MKKILITVIVLAAFQDKFDHQTQYAEGDELQVEKERADDLVSRGLAKVKEVAPPTPPARETKDIKEQTVAEAATPPAGNNPETNTEDDQPGTEE